MKKILLMVFITIFMFVGIVIADQTVRFEWGYDDPVYVDGFRLFQRDQNGTYDYSSPVYDGKLLTTSLTFPNGSYAVVCRAYIGNNESQNSNELLFAISDDLPPVVIPARPNQLIIKFE